MDMPLAFRIEHHLNRLESGGVNLVQFGIFSPGTKAINISGSELW